MTPRFTTHPKALLRASALSGVEELPAWPPVPWGDPSQGRVWLEWLRRIETHPLLAPAIADASPVLFRRLRAVCRDGAQGRDLVRVARSCARYVLRGQGRATPFGLFAGIAPLTFSDAVTGDIGDDHRVVTRLSEAWIAATVARLERSSAPFAARLRLVANDLAAVTSDHVELARQPRSGTDRTGDTIVQRTPAVALALERARAPIVRRHLERDLIRAFPGHDEAARAMVDELVGQRLLLTCLRPPMDTPDPLSHIITAARAAGADRCPKAREILAQLEQVRRALRRHDQAAPGTPRRRARAHARRALARVADTAPDVSVDLQLDSTLTLPRSVAWQAQGAASVLARLNPSPRGTPIWRDYHQRVCERYGVGTLVPVTELVDPHRGLGYPAGFFTSRLPPPPKPPMSDRDATLMDLAQRALLDGSGEVVLDEPTLQRLDAAPEVVLPHTELRMQVLAPTRRALDDGDFELLLEGVSRAAGTTTGRALNLLTPHEQQTRTNPLRNLPTVRSEAISAQLSCSSAYEVGDRISRTPRVLETRLAVGQHHPGHTNADALCVADLAVMADARHLHLMSMSWNRPVEPVVLSAIELTRASHPLMRFLAEVATARIAVTVPFSWGAADRLPFLPRVRWQRCVLAPARWRLNVHDLPGPRTPAAEWDASLGQWRTAYGVPTRVRFGSGDQLLHVDLDQAAHRQLVRDHLDRDEDIALREAPTAQGLGWISGRAHEVTATMTATPTPVAVPSRMSTVAARSPTTEHLPGGTGWLSMRLYGHPDRAPTLITDHLPLLDEMTDQWWFLRYHDPDPHLRVRIRIDRPEQAGPVNEWTRNLRRQGRIADVVHDTYVPETGRFGPDRTMAAAEGLFVADSRAVRAQLAAIGEPTHAPTWAATTRAWAAASMTDLAHHLLGSAEDARSWLITHAPRAPTVRDEMAHTIALTDPTTEVNADQSPAPIRRAWNTRAHATTAYAKALADVGAEPNQVLADLLHLHTTRLFGPDTDTERTCLALARGAALGWTARWKATP